MLILENVRKKPQFHHLKTNTGDIWCNFMLTHRYFCLPGLDPCSIHLQASVA